MDWELLLATVIGLLIGLAAGPVLRRVRPTARTAGRSGSPAGPPGGRSTIVGDENPDLLRMTRRSLDALRAGLVVLDPDDVPVLGNPAARGMGLLLAGPTPGTALAHPLIRTLAARVRRTGVRRDVELDLPRGPEGGPEEPLGLHLRAVGLGGGFIAVEAADVTEAHRLARVRRDFVANVSHELKTPIGALQLLAEAVLDATTPAGGIGPDGSNDPDAGSYDAVAVRRFAERIQHESTRLGRLVNELLELTRLQGAEPLPDPEPVAVDAVLAEVIDRTRTAVSARQITIVVQGRHDLTVYGNATQLATALSNLVENAVAYSGPGSRVMVTVDAEDDQVEMAVTDQGIGIAPEDMDRIFERFYRADQARSRSTGGTGLGLAIVKHIATNHGGRVTVSSILGGGSTFTLRLPGSPPDAVMPPITIR